MSHASSAASRARVYVLALLVQLPRRPNLESCLDERQVGLVREEQQRLQQVRLRLDQRVLELLDGQTRAGRSSQEASDGFDRRDVRQQRLHEVARLLQPRVRG